MKCHVDRYKLRMSACSNVPVKCMGWGVNQRWVLSCFILSTAAHHWDNISPCELAVFPTL